MIQIRIWRKLFIVLPNYYDINGLKLGSDCHKLDKRIVFHGHGVKNLREYTRTLHVVRYSKLSYDYIEFYQNLMNVIG